MQYPEEKSMPEEISTNIAPNATTPTAETCSIRLKIDCPDKKLRLAMTNTIIIAANINDGAYLDKFFFHCINFMAIPLPKDL